MLSLLTITVLVANIVQSFPQLHENVAGNKTFTHKYIPLQTYTSYTKICSTKQTTSK